MKRNAKHYDPLIQFHAELLHDFHQTWRLLNEEAADQEEMERTAHFLLEHAGMLYRYTADEALRREMLAKPEAERKALAVFGCHFVNAKNTIDYLVQLAHIEAFYDEDMYKIQEALKLRDSLDVIDTWAHDITFDICRRRFDLELAQALACLSSQNDQLDDAFRAIPEYVLPALEVFAGMREMVLIQVPEHAWWLGDARHWLEKSNAAVSSAINALAAASARPVKARSRRRHTVYDFVEALFRKLQPALAQSPKDIARLARLCGKPKAPLQFNTVAGMAVASSSRTFTLPVSGSLNLNVVVQWRDEGKIRLALRQEDGNTPEWLEEVRFELRKGRKTLAQWPMLKGKSVLIDSFPSGEKNRSLHVMRGNKSLGEVMVEDSGD